MKRYILTAVCALLLLLSPWLMHMSLSTLPPTRRPAEGWTGALTVVHTETWAPAVGEMTALLQRAGETLKQRHPGVVVWVETVPPEALPDRLAEADAVSFSPRVLAQGDGLCPLTLAEPLLPGLETAGLWQGETRALPWCLGGYGLMWNEELAARCGVTPASDAPVGADLPKGVTALAAGDSPFRRPCSLPYFRHLGLEPAGESRAVFQQFREGKVLCLAAYHGEINRMLARCEAGTSFAACYYPLPEGGSRHTDLVQYAAVTGRGNEARQALAREYVGILLEEEVQLRLEKMGLLSVTGVPREGGRLEELWQAMAQGPLPLAAFEAQTP